MKSHTATQRAVHWSLLAGTVLAPLSSLAATADPAPSSPLSAPDTSPVALMHARHWQADLGPSEFLVSEKLDGVRAFWDGQRLRFRSGRLIAAPAWFLAALPATPLDGELWLGRGRFDDTSAAVRRQVPDDTEWRALHYMVFDLPGESGPFRDRAARAHELLAQAGVLWLQAVAQTSAADARQLDDRLRQVVGEGAEGLMLHRASALWAPGRSESLRKLKPVPDEEARIVGYVPGKGRHAGRVGALLMALPGGQQFALGTGLSDALRASPPPLGTLVTYRYRARTATGLPRFASFLRVASVD